MDRNTYFLGNGHPSHIKCSLLLKVTIASTIFHYPLICLFQLSLSFLAHYFSSYVLTSFLISNGMTVYRLKRCLPPPPKKTTDYSNKCTCIWTCTGLIRHLVWRHIAYWITWNLIFGNRTPKLERMYMVGQYSLHCLLLFFKFDY